jgi:hypothetical protein
VSSHANDRRQERLDAYLDGLMSVEERATFEREIATDPALQAEISLQHEINSSLRRLFVPPARVPELRSAPHARPAPVQRRNWMFGNIGVRHVAAAVIGLVGLAWALWSVTSPPDRTPPGHPEFKTIAQAYLDEVASGYRESWRCRDTREFATYVWRHVGAGLAFANLPPTVQALGLDGCYCISPNTVYLLTKVGPENVIIFIDRKDARANLADLPAAGLHAFHRDVGELRLYEVSPLNEPHVLEHFHEFEMPEEWKSANEPILQ